LAPDGGSERADALLATVRERLSDPRVAAELPPGRCQVASASFPADARSGDFLFAAARRRLELSVLPAAPIADETLDRFRHRSPELGFGSQRMLPILRQIEKVAASDATVLVLGETGTGKEVAAQLIHRMSTRAAHAFVAVHCAALPEKLLESELFGYEKGAF